ncbi:helix-turn-helix transcriptional regulator [Emticicia sp. TH156]|uniref:helix-turn-helix transcriptional regulator n=1 Tax=Emticicia sp. TH156 TaxID=2067454 RepID=UPI000C78AA26|nr:helix-turn-helix transcriptional regulator [Emticicia sp. TH156]PLK44468.1 XRE family transcriptional regulator [Emticicia sp. TH156]
MEKEILIEKLDKIANVDTSWQDEHLYYQENKSWLDRSAKIAIQVLSVLRKNRKESKPPATQKELAELLGISPQQVNKIVKGNENLTLETISRLENALSVQLITVATPAVAAIDAPVAWVAEDEVGYTAGLDADTIVGAKGAPSKE